MPANLGKCRVWNRGGLESPGLALLGADVWVGGASTPTEEQGIKVLGTPIGSPAFVAAQTDRRMGEERRFLDMLPDLPELQCAWSLLLHCAVPQSTYMVRTLPPSLAATYANRHDEAMQRVLQDLLGVAEDQAMRDRLAAISTMPMGMGGGGIRSATRAAPCGY